ncbi:MAG: hypothetical protein ACOX6T_12090 [Myxococcales bacterium]|jgi:hypothetical protein
MSSTLRHVARRGSLALTLSRTALVALVTLWAGNALAQFTNKTIGFQAGYVGVDKAALKVAGGPVLGIESTLYLDNGFDLAFRAVAGIHKDQITEKNAVGVFPAIGFRYLLSEEDVRPYLGLNIAYLRFFGADSMPNPNLVALAPMAGLEYYFRSNTALGIQAEYQGIIDIPNGTLTNAFAAVARILWGF